MLATVEEDAVVYVVTEGQALVRMAAFFVVLIGIAVTAPLWFGALLVISPTIPGALIAILLMSVWAVGKIMVQAIVADRAARAPQEQKQTVSLMRYAGRLWARLRSGRAIGRSADS